MKLSKLVHLLNEVLKEDGDSEVRIWSDKSEEGEELASVVQGTEDGDPVQLCGRVTADLLYTAELGGF